jgi:23S rRNA pseudouridine1911/1915/1917 synthase
MTRPALHADTLSFTHPVTGKRVSFAADLPPDMEKAREELQNF